MNAIFARDVTTNRSSRYQAKKELYPSLLLYAVVEKKFQSSMAPFQLYLEENLAGNVAKIEFTVPKLSEISGSFSLTAK